MANKNSSTALNQIASERDNLITERDIKESQIHELTIQIDQFKDAIQLIQKPAKYPIAAGALPPLEALAEIQNRNKSEADKKQQLDDAMQALNLSMASLNNLVNEKKEIEAKIIDLNNEIKWHTEYLPLMPKFVHEFTLYSDRVSNEIRMLENDLQQNRESYKKIESYLNGNPNNYNPYHLYKGNFSIEVWFQKLGEAITHNENRLRLLESQGQPNLENDAIFRSWLIARVQIDEPLQALKEAQKRYIDAVNQLSRLESSCNKILKFKLYELPAMNAVIDDNFRLQRV